MTKNLREAGRLASYVAVIGGGAWMANELADQDPIRLSGIVTEVPDNVDVSQNILGTNQYNVRLRVDVSTDGNPMNHNLDKKYHGKEGSQSFDCGNSLRLYVGSDIPEIGKGDRIWFKLTDGFQRTGREKRTGTPVYWINTSPAKGRLLSIYHADRDKE